MDPKRLRPAEAVSLVGAALLIASLFFTPWYRLTDVPQRTADKFLCGRGVFECSGWQTFPIARWIFLIGAIAPLILIWIVIRNHDLSWPTGQMSMIIGVFVFALIVYNGIVASPGGPIAFGIGIQWGYWLAVVGSFLVLAGAAMRAVQEGGGAPRRPPGQF